MRLILSAKAEQDLEKIGDWIARDSWRQALAVVQLLREACVALTRQPRAYPLIPGYEERGVRRRSLGDYLIFYRVDQDTVAVLRVLHGAREYERLLFPDA